MNIGKKEIKNKTSHKLNKRYLYYLLLTLVFSGLYYYTTRNLIFTIALALIFLILFFLLIERSYKKYDINSLKVKECTKFINNFIITLSINKSINTTYEQVKETFNEELKMIDMNNAQEGVEERIKSLKEYFNLKVYDVFLKLLDQYLFQGGDIIKISQLLLFDTRKMTSLLDDYKVISKRKLIEFASMWGLTMFILVIIQLSMNIFYNQIIQMSFYPIAIFIFFIVFIAFLYVFMSHMLNLDFINFLGEEKNEKFKK